MDRSRIACVVCALSTLALASLRSANALTLVGSATKAKVTVDKVNPANDKLKWKAEFAPAAVPGLDLAAVPVTITVGSFSQTIPSGGFAAKVSSRGTTWLFKGAAGGLKKVKVTHVAGVWEMKAVGVGLTLLGTTNPIALALALGADQGGGSFFFTVKDSPNRTVLKFPPRTVDDADGDGTSADDGDCNDQDPLAFPGAAERCNGADDDCDGTTDEGLGVGAACTSGQGVCSRPGVTVCASDGTVVCGATPGTAGTELCGNGDDDDCDGETDEGFVLGEPCVIGSGACLQAGFTICSADGTGTVCDAPPPPSGCEGGPAIAILQPPNLTLSNAARMTISGTVAPEAVEVLCNGFAAALGAGTFEITLTLEEGGSVVSCVARDAGGNTRTASSAVTVDTQAPRVTIQTPLDGVTLSASPVTVAGLINDVVVGTVNPAEAHVECNGVATAIANRSFVASVPLAPGANTITCVGTDRAGNADTDRVNVALAAPTGPALRLVSGDGQTGAIGTGLSDPLVVELSDQGTPLAGKPVLFQVQDNDGSLRSGSLAGRRVAVVTGGNGQAQVNYTLGSWAGAGGSQVLAVAPGYPGEVLFVSTATPGTATRIVVDSGDVQVGAASERLPLPFVVVVVDAGHNRLAGVSVTFRVVEGGGNLGGAQNVTVETDTDGRAQAVLTLGPGEGAANNFVTATFAGNTGPPAMFAASGKLAGPPAETRVSGVVLDNTNLPIEGVTVGIEDPTSLTNPRALLISTQTDAQGRFALEPAPVGHQILQVEGATTTRPGVWPRLEYDLVTITGRDNTVGMPIYLLPIDVGNGLAVDETTGGTITLPEVPGFSLTIAPASVTFLDGTTRGTVSVTSVHPDKVPMVPAFGQQPRFVVTIQPAGVHFNPPAPMTIPNTEGLAPGQKTEMYSFDHDLGQFVGIGPGTVSDDGSLVVSDPGVGVIKGGWHYAAPPASTGAVGRCNDENHCTNDTPFYDFINADAPPSCKFDPVEDGVPCGTVPFPLKTLSVNCGDKAINVHVADSCEGALGTCTAGACSSSSPFSRYLIYDAAVTAIQSVCDTACVAVDLKNKMRDCLRNFGLRIRCDPQPQGSTCARVPAYSQARCDDSESTPCTNELTFFPLAMGGCPNPGPIAPLILHEMIHSHGCLFGRDDHNVTPHPLDQVYACQEACFPGSTGFAQVQWCYIQ
jgi:hypothetical protein